VTVAQCSLCLCVFWVVTREWLWDKAERKTVTIRLGGQKIWLKQWAEQQGMMGNWISLYLQDSVVKAMGFPGHRCGVIVYGTLALVWCKHNFRILNHSLFVWTFLFLLRFLRRCDWGVQLIARPGTQYHISGNQGYDSNRVPSLSIFHLYCVEDACMGTSTIMPCYDVERLNTKTGYCIKISEKRNYIKSDFFFLVYSWSRVCISQFSCEDIMQQHTW